MSPREFLLPVPGARLHVTSVGPDDGTPIVTIHSGPGESHELLRPWLDSLATGGRRVIYYDQRGGGRSTLDAGVSFGGWRDHVGDLHYLLRHLRAPGVVLLGHSWGALLAMLYALEHRETVGPLILVAPSPIRAVDGDLVRQGEAEALERPAVIVARERFSEEGKLFAKQVAPYLADPSRAGELTPAGRSSAAAKAARDSLGRHDLATSLPSLVGVPSLVLHGQMDPIPPGLSRETARLLGGTFEALPECGHVPFFEAPGPFFSAVEKFLAGLP